MGRSSPKLGDEHWLTGFDVHCYFGPGSTLSCGVDAARAKKEIEVGEAQTSLFAVPAERLQRRITLQELCDLYQGVTGDEYADVGAPWARTTSDDLGDVYDHIMHNPGSFDRAIDGCPFEVAVLTIAKVYAKARDEDVGMNQPASLIMNSEGMLGGGHWFLVAWDIKKRGL